MTLSILFRDLMRETFMALVLHWKRTTFVVAGASTGVAIFVSLTGLSAAGSAAIANSLSSADGILVAARPGGGTADNELFERFLDEPLPSIPGAQSAEIVAVGSRVLLSDAIPSGDQSPEYEAVMVYADTDFTGSAAHWPQTEREVVLSQSLASRLANPPRNPPYVVLIDGTLLTVVDTITVPETLGISPDIVVMKPSGLNGIASTAMTTYRLVAISEPDQVELVAQALPLVLSASQPERISVLTSLPSEKLKAAVSKQTTSWLSAAAWLGILVAAASVALPLMMAVSERKPEIGLRRAMGFPDRAVVLQFTLEGFFAACAGGILGAGLGACAQVVVCTLAHWSTQSDPSTAVSGVAIAALLGIVAGAWSAALAARVSPLEALKPGI